MSEIKNLKPECIWKNFYALTQVPRPSGHLEKVQQFLLDFAKQAGVEAFKDPADNIVMRKPATPGMENKKGVILQAHMDMVPQKTPESTHNFETDPIQPWIDGEWVKAKGTTLGADNGLGVPSPRFPARISSVRRFSCSSRSLRPVSRASSPRRPRRVPPPPRLRRARETPHLQPRRPPPRPLHSKQNFPGMKNGQG